MTAETLDFQKFKVEITCNLKTGEIVWSNATGHPFTDAQTGFNIGPFFVRKEGATNPYYRNISEPRGGTVEQLVIRLGPVSACYIKPTGTIKDMAEALDRWNKGVEREGSVQQQRIKELFGKDMPPTKVIAHPKYEGLMITGKYPDF